MPEKINSGTGLPNMDPKMFDLRNNVMNVLHQTNPSTLDGANHLQRGRSKSGDGFNVASDSQLENARSRLELILKDKNEFESIHGQNSHGATQDGQLA